MMLRKIERARTREKRRKTKKKDELNKHEQIDRYIDFQNTKKTYTRNNPIAIKSQQLEAAKLLLASIMRVELFEIEVCRCYY